MKTHSILIVEDHPLVRRGLRALLQAQPDFRVIGEAANGLEALHLVDQFTPDIVITDIVMPIVGGLDLLRELSQQTPRPLLIVLSLFDDPHYVQAATESGAAAYVLKQTATSFLITAVRDALAGRFFCTPSVSSAALAEIEQRFRHQAWHPADLFTKDEQLVLQLLGARAKPEEIVQRLQHQSLPVRELCQAMTRKLGLTHPAELERYATTWAATQN